MNLLSIVGFGLFIFLCYVFKTIIAPHLPQKEFTFIDINDKEINVPAQSANYPMIIFFSIIGLLFLGFTIIAVVYMWDLSLFNGIIKL
jgi:ABC-type antimicrobial peptide transport system permease subunit